VGGYVVADAVEPVATGGKRPTAGAGWRRLLGEPRLLVGGAILLGLILIGPVGSLSVGTEGLRLGAGPFAQPPTAAHPLGTDATGRDILAMIVHGMVPTLEIGLLAGGLGTAVGVILGLASGYFRGPIDTLIRSAADIMLTIPALAVLVVLAAFLQARTVELMAFVVALFAWPWTARAVRSQALTMREQPYVLVARLSGRGDLGILVFELLPNLLPYVMATFVAAVSGAILAAVGLQLLGLGPITIPTLGLLLQNAFASAALTRGLWWWWGPPTIILVFLFIGLFLVGEALDIIANPRLRRSRGGER
jgi:peptide/nickel transport system permease protein